MTDVLILKRARAKKWQDRTLKKMLFHARDTQFGKLHQFESLLIAEDTIAQFKKMYPSPITKACMVGGRGNTVGKTM